MALESAGSMTHSVDEHDRAFFEQMLTIKEDYRRLADAIHATIGQQGRAVDFGAGLGAIDRRLQELGWYIQAVDFYAPEDMRDNSVPWIEMDLRDAPPPSEGPWWDTVICTETAEHVEPEYEMNVVLNCVEGARKYIVWSAARPGQDWAGHVNCKSPEFWLDAFAWYRWRIDPELTAKLRREMIDRKAQHCGGVENFYILVPVHGAH